MASSAWRDRPMAASMASSSLPAGPTKGWPCRSSCSPGASPTTIQRAWRAPAPNTVWRRVSHKPQAWHWATAVCSAGQSMSATAWALAAGASGRAGALGASGVPGVLAGAFGPAGAASARAAAGGGKTGAAARASGAAAPGWHGPFSLAGRALARGSQWVRMPISASMARWRSLRVSLKVSISAALGRGQRSRRMTMASSR